MPEAHEFDFGPDGLTEQAPPDMLFGQTIITAVQSINAGQGPMFDELSKHLMVTFCLKDLVMPFNQEPVQIEGSLNIMIPADCIVAAANQIARIQKLRASGDG